MAIPTLGELLGMDDVERGRGLEVWYQRDMHFHGFTTGSDPDFVMPREELKRTHVMIGCVAHADGRLPNFERMWMDLQGEMYSPNGEARELILMHGIHHTSMSTGDFFVLPDGRAGVVAFVGFRAGVVTE